MRLIQLKTLSAKEWQVLLSSLVLLPLIALALRLKGFKRTRALLQKWIPGTESPQRDEGDTSNKPQNTLQTAHYVARMVSIAANHGPYHANCLKRSLATWWLLQRRGIAAELNIGVNTDSADFVAHAWVEYMGKTLVEDEHVTKTFSAFR